MSGNVVSEHVLERPGNLVSRAPEPGSQPLWEPGPDGWDRGLNPLSGPSGRQN